LLPVIASAYVAVLVAELAGDKTLYTLGTLAGRHSPMPILIGASMALALKMLVAVLFGHFISTLPAAAITALSAVTFFSMAFAFLFDRAKPEPQATSPSRPFARVAVTSFVAIFVPEWGDPGQLTAGMLVAQGNGPLLVGLAAWLAMVTKAILSVTLGGGLRRFVPRNVMRWASAAICTAMGLLALFRIEI
jgi:putative Ca2+/H+ antiporter (TMEM165/GDT1 family)